MSKASSLHSSQENQSFDKTQKKFQVEKEKYEPQLIFTKK